MGQSYSTGVLSDPSAFATPCASEGGDIPEGCKFYDYVVVGGGTAGCVLASRLSEDPSVSVLLIEAGTSNRDSGVLSRMPMAAPQLFHGPFDWDYKTVPQKEMNDRCIDWPRGKMLGGSSSINFMVFHRCAPEDFDAWERLGADGWGYESLKKYFIKSEKHVQHPSPSVEASAHGREGLMVTREVPTAPIREPLLQAAENLGIPLKRDLNTSEGTLGAGPFLGAVDESHERCSSATAYLSAEVLKRPNLTVAVSVTAEKILFVSDHDGNPRATGVRVSSRAGGPHFVVRASREVILSAGAIGTPQLLMLSGVGPAAHLAELGIPLVRDLPQVGQHLLDHITPCHVVFRAKAGYTYDPYLFSPLRSLFSFLQWRTFGGGPLSTLPVPGALFLRSDDARVPFGSDLPVTDLSSGKGAPDIEIAYSPLAAPRNDGAKPDANSFGITVGASMLKPQSKGSITLSSSSAFDHPIIDPNYLATESDWNAAIKAVRLILRLGRTPPLSDCLDLRNTERPEEGLYGMGDTDPDKITDDDIRKHIREHGKTVWHPTSSARMGKSAEDSVVDPELRVHGLRGLRIVDASVFPDQVSGHPMAVIIAMAERVADMIKISGL